MGRPIRIISIDGTRGAGKSSQITMLSKYFKSTGMTVSTLKATDGDPVQSGIIALNYVETLLPKGPEHIVILDGSIARPMVRDIIGGMSPTNLSEKFKNLTQLYERLDHQYGICSFLMVMDDLDECNKRILKLKHLTGRDDIVEIEAPHVEHDIVSGMRFFNNHIASKNINFEVIDVLPHQSMNEIHKDILVRMERKYDIPKPKRDADEW